MMYKKRYIVSPKIKKVKSLLINKNLHIAGLFCAIAIFWGSIFVQNIGPLSGPDMGGMHYLSSLSAATGQIFTETVIDSDTGVSSGQIIQAVERWAKSGSICGTNNALVMDIIKTPLQGDGLYSCQISSDRTLSDSEMVEVSARTQYPLFGWLPQATGLALGISINMEPADAQNLARFFNLLVYIGLVSISILIIPRGKWFIVTISLLPTSLFLASSLSSDALNIAWATLFSCYVFRLYYLNKKTDKKQIGLLALLGIGLFLLKIAYVPLLVIILALKKRAISTKHKWLLFITIAVIGSVMYLIWSAHWSALAVLVDVAANKAFMIDNILKVILGVLANIAFTLFRIFDYPLVYSYISLLFIGGVALALHGKRFTKPASLSGFWEHYGVVLMSALAIISSLGLTYLALMLTWNDTRVTGFLQLEGFQGRYVLPLLPLTASIFMVYKKKAR